MNGRTVEQVLVRQAAVQRKLSDVVVDRSLPFWRDQSSSSDALLVVSEADVRVGRDVDHAGGRRRVEGDSSVRKRVVTEAGEVLELDSAGSQTREDLRANEGDVSVSTTENDHEMSSGRRTLNSS